MGSSECTVGSIVWVRRRNGSWWPGKILGPNELSASHLTSPRSGTPVKLLGREDASVDWYNLEKSKRVKTFRCGEFDDCIERAEASLGLPVKKREKYARREDAILHALELEKQYIVKKHGKLAFTNFMRETSSDSGRRVFATSSPALENGNGKPRNHELYQLDEKIDVSSMTERNNTPVHFHKPQDRTCPNLQGYNTEESPHQMKGLQDFGLRAIPVNRMIHTSAGFDDLNKMEIDGHSCDVPTNDPCFDNSSDSDPWKPMSKGKRSLDGFVDVSLQRQADYSLQHDFDFISMYEKREDGEGVCQFDYFPAEPPTLFDSHSAPQEQVEMPSSRLDAANNCHRGTFAERTASGLSEETESDSSENTHILEPHVEAAGIMLSDAKTHVKAQTRTNSWGIPEGDRITRNDVCQEVSVDESTSSGFGVCKWLSKRKRNARTLSRRPVSRFSHRAFLEETYRSVNDDTEYSKNDIDFTVGDFQPSTRRFIKSGFPTKDPNFSRDKCFNPGFIGRKGQSLLMDVDLKVQANYQGENVPWVSLTSRLNGKAIIGHPIQIESLEDGSTDILVSLSDLKYDTEEERTLLSWRTGNLEIDENTENQYIHQSGKVRSKKKKKKNPLNHKPETLSSFGCDHNSKKRRRLKNPNYLTNGAIKSVDSSPGAVACVPVKLVFSRLLEAIGRAPSGLAKRGVSTLGTL